MTRVHKADHQLLVALRSCDGKPERRRIIRLCADCRLRAVRLEQGKGVVRGGANTALPVGAVSEKQRLQHVDHLRDVAHVELIGLPVEDVQAQARRDRAAHRALLPKRAKALLIFLGNFVPCSPFIQDEARLAAVGVTVQQRPLLDDGLFDLREDRELLTRVLAGKTRGLVLASLVIVHGNPIWHAALHGVHETPRPSRVVSVWPAGHEKRLRSSKLADVDGKLAVMISVNFRAHPPAAAPVFIPHAPVADAKWLR